MGVLAGDRVLIMDQSAGSGKHAGGQEWVEDSSRRSASNARLLAWLSPRLWPPSCAACRPPSSGCIIESDTIHAVEAMKGTPVGEVTLLQPIVVSPDQLQTPPSGKMTKIRLYLVK